jgi:hypothetical protein
VSLLTALRTRLANRQRCRHHGCPTVVGADRITCALHRGDWVSDLIREALAPWDHIEQPTTKESTP